MLLQSLHVSVFLWWHFPRMLQNNLFKNGTPYNNVYVLHISIGIPSFASPWLCIRIFHTFA